MARIIILILLHVIGDFILQGSKLSKFKALKIPYLLEHVGIYTSIFIIASPIFLGFTFLEGLVFSLVNGVLHLTVDYFFGKFKLYYFEKNESKYNMVVGIDHSIHLILLIATYLLIFPNAIHTSTFIH